MSAVPSPEVRDVESERHERIVDAAATCFERWGVTRTRMEDIAREAGIARTVLYRHVASKAALQQAVMVRHIARRADELHRRVPARGPAGPLILRALLAGLTEPPGDRVSETVLGVEVVHDTASLVATSPAIAEAMHAYWAPYLHHAVARGELRDGVAVDDAVRWLTMIVFYFLTLPEVAPPRHQLEAQLRTFVVDAIVTGGRR